MDLSKMTARARHYVTADGKVDDASSGSSKYKQPEWGADTEIVDILSETTAEVNADEGAALIMEPLSYMPIGGKTYEINYNGTSYSCPCLVDTGDDLGYAFGDLNAAGMPDAPATGEPFVLVFYGETTAANQGFYGMIMPLDGSTTVTVSVKGEVEKIHVIPKEYVEQVPVPPLIATPAGTVGTSGVMYLNMTFAEIQEAISSGRNVVIRYGGDDYVLLMSDNNNGCYIFGAPVWTSDSGEAYIRYDMFRVYGEDSSERALVVKRRYSIAATTHDA